MAWSRQNNRLYDCVRKRYIAKAPEEIIRQKLLHCLIYDLHYPPELIVVEKRLSELPHLKNSADVPKRRFDLLCYTKKESNLYPLLLIECKAGKLQKRMLAQVMGYNCYVGAPFVALVNEKEVVVGWKDGEKEQFLFTLPTYFEILQACGYPQTK